MRPQIQGSFPVTSAPLRESLGEEKRRDKIVYNARPVSAPWNPAFLVFTTFTPSSPPLLVRQATEQYTKQTAKP